MRCGEARERAARLEGKGVGLPVWGKCGSPRGRCRKVRRGGRGAARAPGGRRRRQEGGNSGAGSHHAAAPPMHRRRSGPAARRVRRARSAATLGDACGERAAGRWHEAPTVDSRGGSGSFPDCEKFLLFEVFGDLFHLPARRGNAGGDGPMAGSAVPLRERARARAQGVVPGRCERRGHAGSRARASAPSGLHTPGWAPRRRAVRSASGRVARWD